MHKKLKGDKTFRVKAVLVVCICGTEFTDSHTPLFLVEKIRFLHGLDKKRIKIYEVFFIIEKNLVGIMARGSIYC